MCDFPMMPATPERVAYMLPALASLSAAATTYNFSLLIPSTLGGQLVRHDVARSKKASGKEPQHAVPLTAYITLPPRVRWCPHARTFTTIIRKCGLATPEWCDGAAGPAGAGGDGPSTTRDLCVPDWGNKCKRRVALGRVIVLAISFVRAAHKLHPGTYRLPHAVVTETKDAWYRHLAKTDCCTGQQLLESPTWRAAFGLSPRLVTLAAHLSRSFFGVERPHVGAMLRIAYNARMRAMHPSPIITGSCAAVMDVLNRHVAAAASGNVVATSPRFNFLATDWFAAADGRPQNFENGLFACWDAVFANATAPTWWWPDDRMLIAATTVSKMTAERRDDTEGWRAMVDVSSTLIRGHVHMHCVSTLPHAL